MVTLETPWTAAQLLPSDAFTPIHPDRGAYTLTMRECRGAEAVLSQLEAEPQAGEGALHVGWGSFRNLDIVAARQSHHVLLLDVSAHQLNVWAAVGEALCQAGVDDPAAFVEAVLPRLPAQPRLRQFAASTRTWLSSDLERPGSWLWAERPDRFAWVQRVFREGRVAVRCLDLRGGAEPGVFERVASRLVHARTLAGVVPDTLYVSNLPWMMAQPQGFFGEAHAPHLPVSDAPALGQVRCHLACLAPQFRWVVSAGQLAPDASSDNLQWQTQLMWPAEFLAPEHWGR